jgi:hypothetical protein
MYKVFCDICGTEITGYSRMTRSGNGRLMVERQAAHGSGHNYFRFEVMVGTDGVANQGDFCKYCIIDSINCADDRARAA